MHWNIFLYNLKSSKILTTYVVILRFVSNKVSCTDSFSGPRDCAPSTMIAPAHNITRINMALYYAISAVLSLPDK